MKFIPAIDLKDNRCVRLENGKEEKITIFQNDPLEQAKFFESSGCERLHIVDLDGAFGSPNINKETILEIRKNTNIQIELGGGIKSEEDISFWIAQGVDFLILGSIAVINKELVLNLVNKHKNKIYIALDSLNEQIMIKGWIEGSNLNINEVLSFYEQSMIKGFILTDISRDGMLMGLDINLINKIVKKTKKDIIVGGGLSDYEDLRNLKKIINLNLEGVIAGKSFYSGNIQIKEALRICNYNA